jgi:CubicO group peptidase (beta-lactamase class C family)
MQRRTRVGIMLPLLLLLGRAPSAAQHNATLPADKVAKVESAIRVEMAQSKLPGLSVAIVTEQQLRYAQGFGMADLEDTTPAKAATVYRLGSLSKPITATAVMQLAERGKLDLDAPIQQYCPAFPMKPWPVTARQLLAHLGGVRDYDNQKFLAEYFSTRHYSSVTESLNIFKDDPLLQEPGTKYVYSTYGYNLLGCAVEGAAGLSYEDYIQANILTPAGMTQTAVDDIYRIVPNRARGYGKAQDGNLRNTGPADTSNKIPAGGLVSTVEDLARFAIALQQSKLISKATTAQMWTLQRTRAGQEIPYGLGWRISTRNGLREVHHGGAAAGFSTFLYMLPDKGTVVVLMTNLELYGQRRDELARQLADIVLQ